MLEEISDDNIIRAWLLRSGFMNTVPGWKKGSKIVSALIALLNPTISYWTEIHRSSGQCPNDSVICHIELCQLVC
jgi:hypothetical protein